MIVARRDGYSIGWNTPKYAYFDLDAQLPADLAYEVKVGSGEAEGFTRDMGCELVAFVARVVDLGRAIAGAWRR